jgi:glycine betaine/proline transport system permease protein
MASYSAWFDHLGLRPWCDAGSATDPVSMQDLISQSHGNAVEAPWWDTPFPSLDNLNKACRAIESTRDLTTGIESGFLAIKDDLKIVLDPLTQPLSWLLNATLHVFEMIPWWVLIPALLLLVWYVSRAIGVTVFVAVSFLFFAFIGYYSYAIDTLSIIFVCTMLCIIIGVPIGIIMSKSNAFQRSVIPILDMLQTLPSFVYLIPLIFLFSVTEPKLYGIAIILYAIVPVIRLTDLGIRLVDRDVLEAVDAFGMTWRQKLFGVEIPLAIPNIMAGVNQTIMMALAMVVIASLVSAPGLGVLVLRGINNLELGTGLVAGFGIVLLAVILDRVSKSAVRRVSVFHHH